MLHTHPRTKAPWLHFLATWLLSSLVLSAVHGAAIGTFFGLSIATGYLAAVHWRSLVKQGRSHQPVDAQSQSSGEHSTRAA